MKEILLKYNFSKLYTYLYLKTKIKDEDNISKEEIIKFFKKKIGVEIDKNSIIFCFSTQPYINFNYNIPIEIRIEDSNNALKRKIKILKMFDKSVLKTDFKLEYYKNISMYDLYAKYLYPNNKRIKSYKINDDDYTSNEKVKILIKEKF